MKDELRANILQKLESGEPLFPGIHGYEETVLPQIANALLARHNFILLGLRGQAKSRILRGLIDFLDAEIPYITGCEIHDNPLAPLCQGLPRPDRREGRRHAHFLAAGATRASSKSWPLRT